MTMHDILTSKALSTDRAFVLDIIVMGGSMTQHVLVSLIHFATEASVRRFGLGTVPASLLSHHPTGLGSSVLEGETWYHVVLNHLVVGTRSEASSNGAFRSNTSDSRE